MPVQATNTFTLNRFQFLGMITNEYLDQIQPVAAKAPDCDADNFSAGRAISPIPAITRHHLKQGAQKNTVLGPAGWFHIGWNFCGTNLSATRITFRYITDMATDLDGTHL